MILIQCVSFRIQQNNNASGLGITNIKGQLFIWLDPRGLEALCAPCGYDNKPKSITWSPACPSYQGCPQCEALQYAPAPGMKAGARQGSVIWNQTAHAHTSHADVCTNKASKHMAYSGKLLGLWKITKAKAAVGFH